MRAIIVCAALAALAVAHPGCSRGPGTSDLYLLEELEAATAVKDPVKRIERLEIYAVKHARHPYRALAVERMLEAASPAGGELLARTRAYFDAALEGERDPAVRGRLLLAKFRFLREADPSAALGLARAALESGESDFRLWMHMSYVLMDWEGQEQLADSVFRFLIGGDAHAPPVPAGDGEPVALLHARTVYAGFLDGRGRAEEAFGQLRRAAEYPFAARILGERLWESGDREGAVEAYVRLVAGVPGARAAVKLDSLHALVHPGAPDLDRRIVGRRIFYGPPAPPMSFVDARGRRHAIPPKRGVKLVLVAFSPT